MFDAVAGSLEAHRLIAMHRAADAAARATVAHFRRPLEVENKAPTGFDPVTVADRDAEAAIREVLTRAFPDYAFLGEEGGETGAPGGPRWVVDPIDGTRAFVTGLPLWGTLLALEEHGRVVLGMLDQPVLGERFVGWSGGAVLHERQGSRILHTRRDRSLAQAVLQATTPDMFVAPRERAGFERVRARVAMTRFGGDCYAYALLAMGHIDLVIESDLQPYDVQAVIAIVEAAGGVFTDWQGGPALEGGAIVAAASKALHDEVLERLREPAPTPIGVTVHP